MSCERALKEYSDETLNISDKGHKGKSRNSWYEIIEKYIFFLFPIVCILEFCKYRGVFLSHQSRIFKNLNLRKKAGRNFRRTFLKNQFRHLNLYSNPPTWLARSCCHMGTFWKTKHWSSHFWESQPFRFWCVEVHCQRRLKSTKKGISS